VHDTPTTTDGCGVCGAPAGDDAYLCRTCTLKLGADLRDVPSLWQELDTTRTRQDKLVLNSGAPSGAERPLFFNEHAAQAAWDLHATLNAWCLDVSRLTEDDRDQLAVVDQHDVPGLSEWLTRNMRTLRQHDEAAAAYDEIIDTIRRARRAIDRPENRTRFEVGPCPEILPEGTCDGKVWAFIPVSEDKVSFMRCLECGHDWDTTQWLRVGRRILTRMSQLKSA
jgi:hypothetical protein